MLRSGYYGFAPHWMPWIDWVRADSLAFCLLFVVPEASDPCVKSVQNHGPRTQNRPGFFRGLRGVEAIPSQADFQNVVVLRLQMPGLAQPRSPGVGLRDHGEAGPTLRPLSRVIPPCPPHVRPPVSSRDSSKSPSPHLPPCLPHPGMASGPWVWYPGLSSKICHSRVCPRAGVLLLCLSIGPSAELHMPGPPGSLRPSSHRALFPDTRPCQSLSLPSCPLSIHGPRQRASPPSTEVACDRLQCRPRQAEQPSHPRQAPQSTPASCRPNTASHTRQETEQDT